MTESTKFAIVHAGGKQYRVTPGARLVVGRLEGKPGESVVFGQVMLLGSSGSADIKEGKPWVDGAKVNAKILAHDRSRKVVIFKKRRRKGYTKKQGHRQDQTRILVESIEG